MNIQDEAQKIHSKYGMTEKANYEILLCEKYADEYHKIKYQKSAIPNVSRIIDWKELRNNFFNECTTETPREESGKKVNMSPHDLFEWFKREISEYVG